MTQHQNDSPTSEGSAADEPNPPDPTAGTDSTDLTDAADPAAGSQSDSFTLAGPGSDPAAPAVQPATGGSDESAVTLAPSGSADVPLSVGGRTATPSADYDKYGVPTLDFVRDKIEARYAASLGAEELARQTEEAKSFEQRAEERAKAAEAALDQIRKSLREHRQS